MPLPVGPLRLNEANIDPFYAPLFIPLALNFGFAFADDISESKVLPLLPLVLENQKHRLQIGTLAL